MSKNAKIVGCIAIIVVLIIVMLIIFLGTFVFKKETKEGIKESLEKKNFTIMDIMVGNPINEEGQIKSLYYALKAKGIYLSLEEVENFYKNRKSEEDIESLVSTHNDIKSDNMTFEDEVVLLSRNSDMHIYSPEDYEKDYECYFISSILNEKYPLAYCETYYLRDTKIDGLWCMKEIDKDTYHLCLVDGYKIENKEVLYDELIPLFKFEFKKEMNYIEIEKIID